MAKKTNLAVKKLLDWDQYKDKTPELSLESIYKHIETKSLEMCNWYWNSIKAKKQMSIFAMISALILLIVGTTLPIISAIQENTDMRLAFTQWGVALLVIAGLVTVSDRIFGWSSGWMRYISTVTTMENLTRAFELEWASYIVSKDKPLDISDVKVLFDLSITLEKELTKLQAEETTKWIGEFNTSISLLQSLIKSQREETDKKLDIIRTNLSSQANAAKVDEKLKLPGAMEVSFVFNNEPIKLKISLDLQTAIEFFGYTWAKLNLLPGTHLLSIEIMSNPSRKIEKVIEIQPATIVKTVINIES